MKIPVINSGTSSVRCRLFAMPEGSVLAAGEVERIGDGNALLRFESPVVSLNKERTADKHHRALRILMDTSSACGCHGTWHRRVSTRAPESPVPAPAIPTDEARRIAVETHDLVRKEQQQ